MLGVYIHIPFCKRKCIYCDFYSCISNNEKKNSYKDAIIKTIEDRAKKLEEQEKQIDTIYFGGGTPTCLDENSLAEILEAVKENYKVSETAEIAIEANPSSVNLDKLKTLRKAGFNRISFGVQSAIDTELLALSRLHDFSQAKKSIEQAKEAGFENISADLMIGIIDQTEESMEKSIDEFIKLPINHISCYMLKVEEGTPLSKIEGLDNIIPNGDKISDMYLKMVDKLNQNGFYQYEISNFSKKGFESKHNLKYWNAEEYLGFGVKAHSYFRDKRFFVSDDLDDFINGSETLMITDENINKAYEYIMLSLRLKSGISLKKLKELDKNNEYGDIIKKCEKLNNLSHRDLVNITDYNISLTPQGFLVSNEILSDILI